ncbi:hypothetical protein [Corynebacterium glutamicum]|uniref:hypothetical protein n=1 Tax=Corynebacterium glutamicum TaxID=1718 RepID=UPI001468957E|nr:hypothetical protein [Corynebacterium glutamicum]GFK19306.1 hypothetical protein KbCgl_18780 [Corynebacterium glutamicum]
MVNYTPGKFDPIPEKPYGHTRRSGDDSIDLLFFQTKEDCDRWRENEFAQKRVPRYTIENPTRQQRVEDWVHETLDDNRLENAVMLIHSQAHIAQNISHDEAVDAIKSWQPPTHADIFDEWQNQIEDWEDLQ